MPVRGNKVTQTYNTNSIENQVEVHTYTSSALANNYFYFMIY